MTGRGDGVIVRLDGYLGVVAHRLTTVGLADYLTVSSVAGQTDTVTSVLPPTA